MFKDLNLRLHLLLRQEDLKTHNLELELVDKKRKVPRACFWRAALIPLILSLNLNLLDRWTKTCSLEPKLPVGLNKSFQHIPTVSTSVYIQGICGSLFCYILLYFIIFYYILLYVIIFYYMLLYFIIFYYILLYFISLSLSGSQVFASKDIELKQLPGRSCTLYTLVLARFTPRFMKIGKFEILLVLYALFCPIIEDVPLRVLRWLL